MVKLNTLFFSGLFCVAATATSADIIQPFVLVQRNCNPGDITIDKDQPALSVTTNCIWHLKEDTDMQLSLHIAKDVDYVKGTCIFTPFIPHDKNQKIDQVADVATSKAGWFTGWASPVPLFPGDYKTLLKGKYTITSGENNTQIIKLIIKNYRNNLDADQIHYHANVIFDLNTPRGDRWSELIPFNELNQLTCSFSPSSTYNSLDDK